VARPSRIAEKRRELLPVLARAFVELGYRKATTAALAKRCDIQENVLYRFWPDKKAMFLAAIDFTYDFSERTWLKLLESGGGDCSSAQRLLQYESEHHGEFGHYRIAFVALSECDEPEIREALGRMYARFHRFLQVQIVSHRRSARDDGLPPDLAAWAAIGLGTVASIGRELGLLSEKQRRELIRSVGGRLLEGKSA
jgi:AcrR family transcriptional regulator